MIVNVCDDAIKKVLPYPPYPPASAFLISRYISPNVLAQVVEIQRSIGDQVNPNREAIVQSRRQVTGGLGD